VGQLAHFGRGFAAQRVTARAPPAMLLNIKGIGPEFATVLWSEGLFRHFDNRRQVASYAGLAPLASIMALGQPRALGNTTRKTTRRRVVSANKVNMGRYKFRLKGRNEMDMPAIVEPIEPDPAPPVRAMAAICFTKNGGLELRAVPGSSVEEIAAIERIELVQWFYTEPAIRLVHGYADHQQDWRARLDEANITWTGNRGQATIRV
jgi:Transposase IS116/IS110/IS902 family